MSASATLPRLRSEEQRRRQLTLTKRRATALLGAVTVVFVIVTASGAGGAWAGYLQAAAEASMVGGLADWFAVTALFRHPLGLPIPHTAVVVERKDQFATTLGDFIQESFLTHEAILDRLRSAGVVNRLADWLAEPANASRLAAELSDALVAVADLLREEEVHAALEAFVRSRVDGIALAPLAGRALRFVTADGRHEELVDTGIQALDRYLAEHRDELRHRLGDRSPWWLPGAVEDRIFERLLDGVRTVLRDMASNRNHHLRREFEARISRLASDLETSPELRVRGERLKQDLLAQPQLRDLIADAWRDVRTQLRAQASDPDSELRRRVTEALLAAAGRLREDPELRGKVQGALETAVIYVAEHFDGEIAGLVTGTIARWDAHETARRLELLLGPDLQYIRINGTVVGGLTGVVLHAVTLALR